MTAKNNKSMPIMILQAICLAILVASALTNQTVPLLYSVGLSLTLLYLLVIKDLKRSLLVAGTWFVVWCICGNLILYYHQLYYNQVPPLTIAGFHPGLFVLWPVLWLLTYFITTCLYVLWFDKVGVSEEDLKKFYEELEKLKR
jgi:FtsH-binding integral membrane protein